MRLRLEPILVATGEKDGQGRLALLDGRLVAVLVHLEHDHGDESGRWFLEKGFGPLDSPVHVSFPDLAAAEAWLAAHLRE